MHSYREFQGCVHYVKRKKKARKIYGKMRTCTVTVGAQTSLFSLDLGATVVYEVFYWTKIGVTMTFVIDFTQNSGKS